MLKINKVAKNLLSIGVSSFASQLIMFFLIAYYARVLSVESFGIVNLAQSILVYFTMITLFGFQTLGTREVSKAGKNLGQLTAYIGIIRLVVSIICFVIVILIGSLSNKGIAFSNLLIVYAFTLFPLAFNIDWLFSGTQEMQYNGIYNLIKSAVPFILSILFIKGEEHIYYIPIFTLVGLIIGVIYQAYIFKKKKGLSIIFKIEKKQLFKYILSSTPFLISALLSMINMNVDTIIIGFTRSEYELGIYSSAYKIIFFLINLIAVIFTPFFPLLISNFHKKDTENLQRVVYDLCKIVILLALPITVGGIILSKEIIILLFGKKYIEAFLPFIILLIYIFTLFMRETYGYSLNAWNMEDKYLKSVILSSAANLILNLIFIPKYGIKAAAMTTAFSELINFFIMRKYSTQIVKTDYLSNIVKLILPLLTMSTVVCVLKYLNIHVLVNIALAILVYFISLIGFKYISLKDLKGILRKNN